MHHILEVTAQAVTQYLNAQIEARRTGGDDFDSWAVRCRMPLIMSFRCLTCRR